MAYDLDKIFGPIIAPASATLPKARAVVWFSQWPDAYYVHPVECRRKPDGTETVVLDLDIEVAQRTVHPIRPVERVAISFKPADADYPSVVSLREDFPDVPHLFFRRRGSPKSFCLYAESYAELRLHWTAHRFVERIRAWLGKTAEGTLHPNDQPLEPLLTVAHGTLVVPAELLSGNEAGQPLYYVSARDLNEQRPVWIALRLPPGKTFKRPPTHVALAFTCPPQTHGMITEQPERLAELDEFLQRSGFSLVAEVEKLLAAWQASADFGQFVHATPFLIFSLPKRRTDTGEVERIEHVAFMCACSLLEFEERVSTFGAAQNHEGLIQIPETVRQNADIPVLPFDIALQFSRTTAALYNGIDPEDRSFCLLGAGAIGSQVLQNLLRSGFGEWTVIDNDKLMPHNLARHSLGGAFVGWNKASAIAMLAQQLVHEEVAMPINANLLSDTSEAASLTEALSEAELVVDCSASVPVARRLAIGELSARRCVSLFLNPAGDALILLAEDAQRKCRLDWLEMQYYREIVANSAFERHLRTTSRTRYSNACRSITSQVSQELVALFSAVGSRALRQLVASNDSRICVWSADDCLQVQKHEVSVEPLIIKECQEWTVCTDHHLLQKVVGYRQARLPNETGGVLLGSFDVQRRIIYVVDTLPSPPDSVEWPTAYIRGARGLAEAVREVERRSMANLEYIGEWHSHPDRCSVNQSDVDIVAMLEITAEMAKAGLPAVMMIVGENLDHQFYVGHAIEQVHLDHANEPSKRAEELEENARS